MSDTANCRYQQQGGCKRKQDVLTQARCSATETATLSASILLQSVLYGERQGGGHHRRQAGSATEQATCASTAEASGTVTEGRPRSTKTTDAVQMTTPLARNSRILNVQRRYSRGLPPRRSQPNAATSATNTQASTRERVYGIYGTESDGL